MAKKKIISKTKDMVIFIDEHGNKRWKFTTKKGAIYGKVRVVLMKGRKKIQEKLINDRYDLLDVVNSWNRARYYSGQSGRWHIKR